MRHCVMILGLLLGGAHGCSSERAPAGPGVTVTPPEGFRPQLLLSDSQEGLENGKYATHFNFSPLRDLWFRAQVPGMPGVALLTIQFVSPQGQSFYTDAFPFSVDPEMKEMPMATADHPVAVVRARSIPGGFVLDHQVQIAGTVFHRYPIPGMWKVLVTVEGYAGVLSSPLDVEFSR